MRIATSMLWQQPLVPGQLYGGRYLRQSMLTEGAPVPSPSVPFAAAVLVLSSQVLRRGRKGWCKMYEDVRPGALQIYLYRCPQLRGSSRDGIRAPLTHQPSVPFGVMSAGDKRF